jgi:soluble lytic murein transglycosylase
MRFPAGTDITKLDLSTRDIYTSLAWLAGEYGLLQSWADRAMLVEMFKLYSAGARTPQTRAKGLYWAGRAAKKAGDQQLAQQYLTEAARYYDFFHGQLALEALGGRCPQFRPPALPQLAANAVPPTYTAARMSSSFPGWRDSNSFMRALSNKAKTESDFKNLFAWSNLIGRPDLSVIAARSARIEGLRRPDPPWLSDRRGSAGAGEQLDLHPRHCTAGKPV